MSKDLYKYEGPVYIFEMMVMPHWSAVTAARSLAEAKNNISYRAKTYLGRTKNSKINLPGRFILVEKHEDIDPGVQLKMKI